MKNFMSKFSIKIILILCIVLVITFLVYYSHNIKFIISKGDLSKLLLYDFSNAEIVDLHIMKPEWYDVNSDTSICVIAKNDTMTFSDESIHYVKDSDENTFEDIEYTKLVYSYWKQDFQNLNLPEFDEILSSGVFCGGVTFFNFDGIEHWTSNTVWFQYESNGESYICFTRYIPGIVFNFM